MRTAFAAAALTLTLTLGSACSDPENAPEKGRGLPCQVEAIVEKHCGLCHGETPAAGAPMSLVRQTDFQRQERGSPLYERVKERLHSQEATMPPLDQPQLSAQELAALDAWLEQGAPRSSETCEQAQPSTPEEQEVDLSACEELLELRAHDGDSESGGEGFSVPLVEDHYECFTFSVPFTDKVQVLRMDPLIDDARVLHHWLLYQQSANSAGAPGSHEACLGVHADGSVVGGWAPGGEPIVMPDDVGLQMHPGPDSVFVLEIHYNNAPRHPDARDRSGARLCLTRSLREHEAATHQLGTELIFLSPGAGSTTSTCSPPQTAHIIGVSPHMHRLGRRMTTLITRADGSSEPLLDKPFDFMDQRMYMMDPVTVGPGDRLTTTCRYDNDTGGLVLFGSRTADEMCYSYVVAYPAGALATGGGLLPGENKCMR